MADAFPCPKHRQRRVIQSAGVRRFRKIDPLFKRSAVSRDAANDDGSFGLAGPCAVDDKRA